MSSSVGMASEIIKNNLSPQQTTQGLSQVVASANKVVISDNQTVAVQLSSSDPNRLFVQGDKIKNASCLQGFCGINYTSSGGVYITLGHSAIVSSGFSIFVDTENGKHFTVIGLPSAVMGQTVEFTVSGGTSPKATAFEKNTPYQSMLVSMIASMMNYHLKGKPLDHGLSVLDIPYDEAIKPTQSGLLIQPILMFNGGQLQGLVYSIKNASNKSIHLTTKQFYQKSMLAGSLSKQDLKPLEVGYFYGVIEKGSSDV